jgi:hypothetical protein
MEQARMADVKLLLESAFEREDVTVRLILNCLYDIGVVNLINQRVANRPLNRLAQCSAKFSKPVVKIFAMRWFKRNCPQLITSWLYTKVKFEPKQIAQVVEAAEQAGSVQEIQEYGLAVGLDQQSTQKPDPLAIGQASILELAACRQKVKLLQARVRLLAVLLAGVSITLGGGLAWSVWQGAAWRTEPNSTVSIERPQP